MQSMPTLSTFSCILPDFVVWQVYRRKCYVIISGVVPDLDTSMVGWPEKLLGNQKLHS